jgi:hypothetical protein
MNQPTSLHRTYVVHQSHPQASDGGTGTPDVPFLTINQAASLAQPGDTILVRAGIYRERVNPRRGGEPTQPITYLAAAGEAVYLRGSEPFTPAWEAVKGQPGVFRGSLDSLQFGSAAYAGHMDEALYGEFNPFFLSFNKARIARPHSLVVETLQKNLEEAAAKVEQEVAAGADMAFSAATNRKGDLERELQERTVEMDRRYLTTLGQLFADGAPLRQVETSEELAATPGTWMVSPEADALFVHFMHGQESPSSWNVEVSVRHTVFSPLTRGLGYIVVRGFIIEHAANHFPTWGERGWAQVGAVSCRSGHHWVIEKNEIRYAKGLGIDCGSEGGREKMENRGAEPSNVPHGEQDWSQCGYHEIRDNWIHDNGHCGIAGIGHHGTRVTGNLIERNNRDGWTSPWWEFGGIKFHFFFDGLIEGNVIRDNEAHGIWIDNQWRGSRITRNVIVNNLWSGINVELGRGPVMIDHNVIALTRKGDGIYGHDLADVTIAHNLLYANAHFGAWFAFATPRVKPENGCWAIRILNNIVAGNCAGALALPMPWQCAGDNHSDGNLFVGSGEYLDEGSGSRPPLFQLTNDTHMANMPRFYPAGFEAQSPERVIAKLIEALRAAHVPETEWPNLNTWSPHYLLTLAQWRATTTSDENSRVMPSIRDGLASRVLSWEMKFDETLYAVKCQMIPSLAHDFHGKPFTAAHLLPGPFQSLQLGQRRVLLWPVPGIETQWSAL